MSGTRKLEEIEQDVLTLAASAPPLRAVRMTDEETRKLAERTLEDVSAVSSQWLGHATPIVERLIHLAENQTVTDADFVRAVQQIEKAMPDLLPKLNWHALANALERAQGAAVVNGALARQREFLRRKPKQ